jgi:hypothetical protein
MPRSDTGQGLWTEFEHNLVRTLLGFEPGNFAILEDPDVPPDKYVQFALQPNKALQAECAGPKSEGGTASWTRTEERTLTDMGWGEVDSRAGWANYRVFWTPSRPGGSLSRTDAEDAADLTRRTFEQVFSTSNPRRIKVQVDHFEAGAPSAADRLTATERRALIEAVRHTSMRDLGRAMAWVMVGSRASSRR